MGFAEGGGGGQVVCFTGVQEDVEEVFEEFSGGGVVAGSCAG